MKDALISDCAERADNDPCDGAIRAAVGIVASTDTSSLRPATLSVTAIVSVAPAANLTPSRRLTAKPGAVTSIAYVPGGRSGAEKRPSASVTVVRIDPLSTWRIMTAAFGTVLASGSRTDPWMIPTPGLDWARSTGGIAHSASA